MGSGYRIEHLGQKDGSGPLNSTRRHGSFLKSGPREIYIFPFIHIDAF